MKSTTFRSTIWNLTSKVQAKISNFYIRMHWSSMSLLIKSLNIKMSAMILSSTTSGTLICLGIPRKNERSCSINCNNIHWSTSRMKRIVCLCQSSESPTSKASRRGDLSLVMSGLKISSSRTVLARRGSSIGSSRSIRTYRTYSYEESLISKK